MFTPSQLVQDLNMIVDLPGLEEKDFKQPTVNRITITYATSTEVGNSIGNMN